ncbi:MAG: leucine-rich repeat domain-containing protein, partial [Clostridia bacterium]|nr:leucine-rich repeat domain-containing protein [Clostridia bacterium]
FPEYDSGLLDKKVEVIYGAEKVYDEAVTLTEKEDGTYEFTATVNRDNATEIRIESADGKKVTSVAHHPFKWDEKIETVYIGKDVAELKGEAFVNLRALKAFVVDEDNESFCAVDGVLYTKDMKTLLCCPKAYEGGAEFTVPEKVEIISRSAFSDCKFEKIYLPEGLKRIESMAFLKAEALKEIVSYKGEKTYASLPEGLEFIGLDAFNYASGLTYLYIPASVTELGAYSFTYCAKLDKDGNKTGLTEINVAASAEAFKAVKVGEHWIPEFRNEANETAAVNYGAERA